MNKIFCLTFLVIAFFLSGCFEEKPTKKIDFSHRENISIKPQENVVTYAYLPQFSHSVSYERHHQLIKYLREKTGLNIRQVFPNTFDDHVRMVGMGKIDISFSNPFVYVKIAYLYHAQAFARVVEKYGAKNFRGKIICRADNRQIIKIEDCKGKKWIAVDPFSAAGYLYPLAHFIEHGINISDFAEIAFAPGPGGKQEKVIISVYSGRYDVGSIREGAMDVVADKIDINKIKVINYTRWYPGWVYSARRDLNPVIVKKIKKALLSLNFEDSRDRIILEKADIRAIIPSEDSDFDSIRRLFAKIGGSFCE